MAPGRCQYAAAEQARIVILTDDGASFWIDDQPGLPVRRS
jgi:hypothetical protein